MSEPVAAARCVQGGAHRGAPRKKIDWPRRDRQRLPRFLGVARGRRLLSATHPPFRASVGHRRVALPVSLRRSAGAPAAATGSSDVVLFRRWPGALQGCRRAQEGRTGARHQGAGRARPSGAL